VYYRINDPYRFAFAFTDTPKLLEALAYREMIQYAASATLDEPLSGGDASRPQGIMSFGRGQFEKDLTGRINKAIDRVSGGEGLGVEIVRVQLLASHPPKDAAAAFELVAANERQRDQTRYMAQSEANKSLAEVAGDPDLAWKLAQAITIRMDCRRLQGLRREGQDCTPLLSSALATAQSEVARLNAEIENERLLGKLNEKTQTINQQLLERQLQHVALLEGLQKDLRDDRINAAADKSEADVELLFAMAQGRAAVDVANARAGRWEMEFRERSSVKSFLAQLLNERAAPHLFRLEKYLDVLTVGLRDHRKYVLGVDPDKVEVRMNLEQPHQAMQDIQPSQETKR
jgi:regulator of protease activity HflC (stomatin/prohibitin superfamily)